MWFELNILIIILVLRPEDGHQVYSRKIYGYFDHLDCQYYDANYVEALKCWLQPDQTGQLMMNAEFKLKQDLTNLRNKFQFIVEINKRNLTYLSLDIDICGILGAAMKNPVMRLMLDEIRCTSNLPLSCPLKKGIEYAIHNFTINSKLIPSFTPRLKWMANSNFYTSSRGATEQKIHHFVSAGRVDHIKPNYSVLD